MQREESVDSAEISAEDSARQRIFCEKNHPLVINPIYVLRAIREFVTSIFRGRKEYCLEYTNLNNISFHFIVEQQ